jgi:hypothetical protein
VVKPVYKSVEVDGPPAVGRVSRQRFKGRLAYELTMESKIVRLEPPRALEVEAAGEPHRSRDLDADAARGRARPCPLRLARQRRPAAAALLHPRAAAAVPLEPQLVRAIEGLEPYARAGS